MYLRVSAFACLHVSVVVTALLLCVFVSEKVAAHVAKSIETNCAVAVVVATVVVMVIAVFFKCHFRLL